jgi:hypothetical protein
MIYTRAIGNTMTLKNVILVSSTLFFQIWTCNQSKAQALPTSDLLGNSPTGIDYPNNSNWIDYSYTFSPSLTGSNYVGLAFRQDPAYWTVGNLFLAEGSLPQIGNNLLQNGNFATGGSVPIPSANGDTVQAPQYWGVWYQSGIYPQAAGTWYSPGSADAPAYTFGQGVNTSTAGSWFDGAVGSYDGVYQSNEVSPEHLNLG